MTASAVGIIVYEGWDASAGAGGVLLGLVIWGAVFRARSRGRLHAVSVSPLRQTLLAAGDCL